MADSYWRYTSGGQPAAAPVALLAKRPRSEFDAPNGPEYPGYYGRDDARGMPRVIRDAEPIKASYERYLRSGQMYGQREHIFYWQFQVDWYLSFPKFNYQRHSYKFDEHELDSVSLKLQYARNPGVRSGGGSRGIR